MRMKASETHATDRSQRRRAHSWLRGWVALPGHTRLSEDDRHDVIQARVLSQVPRR